MCEKSKCKYPNKLKDSPEKCSPEQIKECHGEEGEHECEEKEE